LQNGYEMAFWVIMTCGTGSFASGTANSEGALRANYSSDTPQGAIGSIGTATLGTHTRYNNAIFYGVAYGVLWEDMFNLGAALTRGKLEMYTQYYDNEPTQVEIWSHWNNLMGDPATECWTGYPYPLTVAHPAEIAIGANSVPVTVEFIGAPVEGAQVCLLKDGEIHDVAYTDATGFVEMPIPVLTAGDLEITVTEHNRMPYLASIPVSAETVYVGFADTQIDDDANGSSDGNGDGAINPGETIELRVQLRNFGIQNAPGVTATLTTEDPYATITDGEETFGDIAGGATAWSADDFDVQVAPSCPHGRSIRCALEIVSGGDQWHSIVDLPVVSADLVATGESLYNAGGNQILDPGETVQLGVDLRNDGGATATGVTGTLVSETSFVTVLDSQGSWADVPPGGEQENTLDLFTISAAPDAYEGYLASFRLVLSFGDGWSDTTTVTTTIGTRSMNDPIGPDDYGYFAFDNTDTGYEEAPAYDWVEIDPNHGGAGTLIVLNDNGEYQDKSTNIDLPFPFQYYGEVFDRTTVCSNGWISFPTTYLANYRNWYLPAAGGPDGIIACFWDDLRHQTGSGIYQWHDEANHRFVIQWSRMRNEVGGDNNCQLILYDPAFHQTSSGDGIIEMQYAQVENNDYNDNYATVGIEAPDSRTGLTYSYSGNYPNGAAVLTAGRAVRFLPRSEVPSGTISGVVRNDSYGGVPIPNAEVSIEELDRSFVTGENGTYGGTAPVGLYTVTASHPGFDPETVENVEILQGQPTVVDFDLVDNAGPILTTTTHPSTADSAGPYPIP
ncbi:MAG: hypothetical protein GF328_01725, partial [Candidatus Latescibacteria bacterium]|nr:hypothetical protein [Candidatus Latescibacterota bacterium]